MSGSDWEALPDVREWSRGPLGCPGVFVSGLEALPDVRVSPEVVGRPYRMSGRVQECSGGPPGCLGLV